MLVVGRGCIHHGVDLPHMPCIGVADEVEVWMEEARGSLVETEERHLQRGTWDRYKMDCTRVECFLRLRDRSTFPSHPKLTSCPTPKIEAVGA